MIPYEAVRFLSLGTLWKVIRKQGRIQLDTDESTRWHQRIRATWKRGEVLISSLLINCRCVTGSSLFRQNLDTIVPPTAEEAFELELHCGGGSLICGNIYKLNSTSSQ